MFVEPSMGVVAFPSTAYCGAGVSIIITFSEFTGCLFDWLNPALQMWHYRQHRMKMEVQGHQELSGMLR